METGPLSPGRAFGLFLAAHFLLWIHSLEWTSITSSVFLVTLHPVATSLLGAWLLKDRFGSRLWWALACSVAAATVLVGFDRAGAVGHPGRIFGDVLALLGGLAASGYFLLGRRLRRECSTSTYAGVSYSVAAAACLVACVAGRVDPVALPARAWIGAGLLGLVPQLLGHTTLNWALRRLPAGPVAVAITAEPVAATLLAWLCFGEPPGWSFALAAPVAGLSIFLALTSVLPGVLAGPENFPKDCAPPGR